MKKQIQIRATTLELPAYIAHLSQGEIDSIILSGDTTNKIVASGMHPRDGKVLLVLSSGLIKTFDADSYYIPPRKYIPSADGSTVFLPNEDGRWPGTCVGFTVQSSWLISKSESAFSESELLLNNRTLGTMQL